MKNLTKIIIFCCVLTLSTFSNIIAQYKVISSEQLQDGIELKLSFPEEPYLIKPTNKNEIDYYLSKDEGRPGSFALPSKTIFVAIPPASKIHVTLINKEINTRTKVEPSINPEVHISNNSSLIYSDKELSPYYLKGDIYPLYETEIIGYTWIRDFYCAVIKINTHRYNWKKREIYEIKNAGLKIIFDEVKPFVSSENKPGDFDKDLKNIIINYEEAKKYRGIRKTKSDESGDWIDYSKEYVKLGIPDDGIYRIYYSDLIAYGLDPVQIDPRTIKIFLRGKEIPIVVNGEDDSSFNDGDYIEFWATKNYGSTNYRQIVPVESDYLNYMDRYSDTTIVWLTWSGNNGKRVLKENINPEGINDTVNTHLVKLHFEQDKRIWYYDSESPRVQLPSWQENKVWTWQVIGSSGSLTIPFFADNFVPGSMVNTTARLISNASNISANAHLVGSSLNSTQIEDSIKYNFKETINFQSTFNSNLLASGYNNFYLYGMPTAAYPNQSLLDWVDVEYTRYNVAANDSLLVRIPSEINSAKRIVKISNIFSNINDLLVYKIKPQIENINFSLSGTGAQTLTFADTVSGGSEYYINKKEFVKTPCFITKKKFVNLRDSKHGADYIIISNKALAPSTSNYNDFIKETYKIRTELVYADDIYDEFGYGYNQPEAIKSFLFSASNLWAAPKPSYLFLIGGANYDYKNLWDPAPKIIRKNLVPSYGMPVSDSWYTMWDSTNINIQQMYVGRLPASSNEEVNNYLNKHQLYLARKFDEWNKTYLFFSGGDAANPSQLDQIRDANNNVYNNIVTPAPVGGIGHHFYKTINPPTNFGPFSQQEVQDAINTGGLFISYIGHSGTETWDNGIINVANLTNNYNDRFPLITDFGCSTGKFAEPDVDAFSELFICTSSQGQAINYLGNSSWGYFSTSLTYPNLFYSKLLIDTILTMGKAHFLAKMLLLNELGFDDASRVFNYCNLLFGDPIIRFALPQKPNYSIKENDIDILDDSPSDQMDSIRIKINVKNLGLAIVDSVLLSISDELNGKFVYQKDFLLKSPLFSYEFILHLPVKNLAGTHNLSISLDKENKIDEIDENDNSITFQFNILPTSLKAVESNKYYNTSRSKILLINPVTKLPGSNESITVAISTDKSFQNALEIHRPFDSLFTLIALNNLIPNKRYWWKSKIDSSSMGWSDIYSFSNVNVNSPWYIDSTFSQSDLKYNQTDFYPNTKTWGLTKKNNTLKITSGGHIDGELGSILFNGTEFFPNTYYWGIGTALIDSLTLEPKSSKYFLYWDSWSADSLTAYINKLPNGTLLAMTVCSDAQQAVLHSIGSPVRKAIETLGSYYVDSVNYRDSWCIIGKKGAPKGSVPEVYKKQGEGLAIIDTSKFVNFDEGEVEFPVINNSGGWKNIIVKNDIPDETSIDYYPLGIRNDVEVDTLSKLTFTGDTAPISWIDYKLYPSLKILAKLKANIIKQSPTIKEIAVNYIEYPELGTNYQVASVTKDSIIQGDSTKLKSYIYNVGKSSADSFYVKLELVKPNNSRRLLMDSLIVRLDSMERKYYEFNYISNFYDGYGKMMLEISIDPENKTKEVYKDNNIYQIPFLVKQDTTQTSVSSASLKVTFDGVDIFDGDYISPSPNIQMNLSYPVWFSVSDTNSVQVFLDDVRANKSQLDIFSDTIKRIITYKYQPKLTDGEHTLRIFGKDIIGNLENQPGYEKTFQVSNELKLLDVYNYPNPFKDKTSFTFKLTQVPEELFIKIYTVAGRLIKETRVTYAELKIGFNYIPWDGRDEDGNLIANGVYLYKVIVKKDGKSESYTQKLAVVK